MKFWRGRKDMSHKNWRKDRPFNWRDWSDIQDSLPQGKIQQLERWHLWKMHEKPMLVKFATWISEAAQDRWQSNSYVEISSAWVDAYPKAWFNLQQPPGAALQQKVELADLLLVVESNRKKTATCVRRALLLQAKCVDGVDQLDANSTAFPGTDSTHKERNLYESHIGLFDVKTSSAQLATKLPNSPYTLSTTRQIIGLYARHLLIPRQRPIVSYGWPRSLPYQVLTPDSRTSTSGECVHLGEVALSMAGLSAATIQIGERIDRPSQWASLVMDLLGHTKGKKKISRFSETKSTLLNAQASASRAPAIMRSQPLRLPKFRWLSRLSAYWQLHAVPNEPQWADQEEPEPRGFLVIVVRVSDEAIVGSEILGF